VRDAATAVATGERRRRYRRGRPAPQQRPGRPQPGRVEPARRAWARHVPPVTTLQLAVVRGTARLTESSASMDNTLVDPVVIALAQLVRDRWTNEQRDRDAGRSSLTVVPGEPG
jgi:hypothetical protein